MTVTTIKATINHEIMPGEGSYGTPLTIASSGAVQGGNSYAIYGPPAITNFSIVNDGLLNANHISVDLSAGGGTLINPGNITAGTVVNTGEITAATIGGAQGVALMVGFNNNFTNSGTVLPSSDNYGITTPRTDFQTVQVTNAGVIHGLYAGYRGLVSNSGTISASGTAVVSHAGTVFNTGLIEAAVTAVTASDVINSGTTIGAVGNFGGTLTLSVAPGALFEGAVSVSGGQGVLNLLGTSAARLDIGSSFSGFDMISFTSGADWTLEGAATALAAGQTIAGGSGGRYADPRWVPRQHREFLSRRGAGARQWHHQRDAAHAGWLHQFPIQPRLGRPGHRDHRACHRRQPGDADQRRFE